jgi:hypothetical protein
MTGGPWASIATVDPQFLRSHGTLREHLGSLLRFRQIKPVVARAGMAQSAQASAVIPAGPGFLRG